MGSIDRAEITIYTKFDLGLDALLKERKEAEEARIAVAFRIRGSILAKAKANESSSYTLTRIRI